MTFIELSLVGIGGFFGAIMRYLIAKNMNAAGRFPVGTLIANLVGALLLGIVIGLDLARMWTLFYASGLLGAFTTFSTLNKELIELWTTHHKKKAIGYMLATYCVGIMLALLGYFLASVYG